MHYGLIPGARLVYRPGDLDLEATAYFRDGDIIEFPATAAHALETGEPADETESQCFRVVAGGLLTPVARGSWL